jgi:YidC/Oxa1 family membrane protein insertase
MQKASPPGAGNAQQQALLKVMPILFGVFGIFFPAGLVLYWTTSNLWQIGQQHFMLKTRPTEETLAANARSKPQKAEKKGFMSSMMDRAAQERNRRETGGTRSPGGRKPGSPKSGNPKPGTKKPGSGPRKPGGGGNGGGDPKKRPKR